MCAAGASVDTLAFALHPNSQVVVTAAAVASQAKGAVTLNGVASSQSEVRDKHANLEMSKVREDDLCMGLAGRWEPVSGARVRELHLDRCWMPTGRS